MPADSQPLVAVLAAGRASRFGGGKLDAACAGKPVGQWVLDAVATAQLAPGVIVTGPQVPAFAHAAGGWSLLENPDPARGLGSSLALAAAAALAQARALLVLLADMPLLSAGYLARLAAIPGPAATSYPDGAIGVPARIPPAMLADFTDLAGAGGGARLLRDLAGLQVLEPEEIMLLDVDRPADLQRAAALLGGSPAA
jgi:CTP:molybdopterin cytidylyltransferase MocA